MVSNCFFESVWNILNEGNICVKFEEFHKFYKNFKRYHDIDFDLNNEVRLLERPSYANFCNVVSMRDLNKKIPSDKKYVNFIHSIAHIEFCAIDIALDAVYRFRGLPRSYYEDWLEVACDEIRHFNMINELLNDNGVKYGDFVVHDGLFVALCKTQNSLLKRMALLPRYMEANGLDANAHIIKKLEFENNNERLIKILNIILQEEISHVSKGDKWFKYACEHENISTQEYVNIIKELYPNAFKSVRELNENARIKAGFSIDEINNIKMIAKGS